MKEIVIPAVESAKVKFKGESYELEIPDVDMIEKILQAETSDGVESFKLTKKLLADCGLPKAVVSKLKPSEFKAFSELLLGKQTGK
jgi:hypothetical protein